MKHLTILDFGSHVGITGQRVCVGGRDEAENQYPLNRLRSITIAREGVAISSNVILACAQRGIRLFFLDWRGHPAACLYGASSHATVSVRKAQLVNTDGPPAVAIAAKFLSGKIRNQRAVLLYFGKNIEPGDHKTELDRSADQLQTLSARLIAKAPEEKMDVASLLGLEGLAARIYFEGLANSCLLPENFRGRTGRGAIDPVNGAMNYGYAILSSYAWNAVINAGLEPYAGVLHSDRSGKPALVLDVMEEYRAWVVDRNVIKLRGELGRHDSLTPSLRKRIVSNIHETMARTYTYHGKQIRLETILQRQIYRLAGHFAGNKSYRPYVFRW